MACDRTVYSEHTVTSAGRCFKYTTRYDAQTPTRALTGGRAVNPYYIIT